MIEIDPSSRVSEFCDIEDSIRGSLIRIGAQCVIDSFVKIKPAGGSGDLIIGDQVIINSGCVLYTGNGIRIGNQVAIAANCTFAPTNHSFMDSSKPIVEQGFLPSRGGIIIEDDVWIGANSVILDGAHLSSGCVVGAGSLVRGKLQACGIYGGNPLKLIKVRS